MSGKPSFLSPSSLLGRSWRTLRGFLEIIGLLSQSPSVDQQAQLARFRLYHTEFRKLLSANHSFLETLAQLEDRKRGHGFLDKDYIKRMVVRSIADVHAMVESIQVISEGRYPGLVPALQRITQEILSCLQEPTLDSPSELTLDLSQLRASHADIVGGKMANLGELRNALGLPTPDGFSITVEAYRLLLEEAGLRSWIQDQGLTLSSRPAEVEQVSSAIRQRILQAEIPHRLAQAMDCTCKRLLQRLRKPARLSVRSSAIGEDSQLSFAGQFISVLNVSPEELPLAYLKVLASLFSPEAIHYRLLHGIPTESAEMAVGVLAMVPAVASGVVFSRDPSEPEGSEVLIQTVQGLGVTLVEGRVSPQMIRVKGPDQERPCVRRTPSAQTVRLVADGESLLLEQIVEDGDLGASPLSDQEACHLARWALIAEAHFGCPQDMEWAKAPNGSMFLLQARPLRLVGGKRRKREPLEGHKVLLRGGETACPGVSCGVAVHMEEDADPESFPEGSVLVAVGSSPKFIRVMSKVKAIVTDAGSTTGHMASLARELGIPALLNTREATRLVPPGTLVTVDASAQVVYEGEVEELLERWEKEAPSLWVTESSLPGREKDLLDRLLPHVSPLNLTNPADPNFSPEHATTLHDLARYIHEKSYQEMFGLGERLGDMRPHSYLLDVFLPIDLYVLDLGGGLKETPKGRKVKPSQIACLPLRAVMEGMLDERIPRFGPRFMDLGGFFSVMMRHATTAPDQERSFQDPCYAIVSDHYLNYTARVGYHFSVLDTYCSPTPNKNYVSLLFRGGAADYLRRVRRARAISGVLRHFGFSVSLSRDSVTARLGKASMEETVEKLKLLGRLLQFFRQMDAAMATQEHIRIFQEAFIRGDYDLREIPGRNRKSPKREPEARHPP